MLLLEESQLLEDLINDSNVSRCYKLLRDNESSDIRQPLIYILNDEKVVMLSNIIITHCESTKLSNEEKDRIYRRLTIERNDVASLTLILAASLTQLFVIDNFTGAADIDDLDDKLHQIFRTFKYENDYKSLTLDGSEIYHLAINPWLLKLAQMAWRFLEILGCSRRLLELEFLVWKHRYLTIYLSIQQENSELLLKETRKVQEFIFDHYILNEQAENKTQLTRFNVVELCCELIQSALMRDGFTTCRKIFEFASEYSGISIEHTGVLGKRTKFQQKNIPQLVVKVTKKDGPLIKEVQDSLDLPLDVKLDDDTLLPDILFVSIDKDGESTGTEQELEPEEQLLMLTRLEYILKTEVMEESLMDEWTLAYVRSIIRSANVWPIKYKALAMRSVVEKKNMRKMDRALLQLEELIRITEKIERMGSSRLKSIYSVMPLSRWQMQRTLGDLSFDLGLFKNALEVYNQIEYWEGIIKCYSALGESSKSEKVILQELAKHETPYLYCLLADAKDDISLYEKSWTLSNGRFARAKKSIGTYYYVRKDYDNAIVNYELALKASPSNVSILSLLAYSYLICEKYEKAAECYRNLTYQDDTSFLAWNNLSKAYIKLGQNERAWRTLKEAIKCNWEEWKIWENLMVVSVEIGALDDVMTAWHRLIDIKTSHKDDQVLSALTYSLIKRSYCSKDPDSSKQLREGVKLVARLCSTGASSSRVWICYFKLLIREYEIFIQASEGEITNFDIDSRVSKLTNALQRATPNSTTADAQWFLSPDKIEQVIDSCNELADCYTLAFDTMPTRQEIWSQWRSFKLSVRNILVTLRQKGYKNVGAEC